MSERLRSIPEEILEQFELRIDPFDPPVVRAIEELGVRREVENKLRELIRQAGVAQLPQGRSGATALIEGGNLTVQAFGSLLDGEEVHLVVERATPPPHDGKAVTVVSFGVESEKEAIWVTLQNEIKKNVWEELRGEGGEESAQFEERELSGLSDGEAKQLIKRFLEAKPNQARAEAHFERLTNPRTGTPGRGKVVKLF